MWIASRIGFYSINFYPDKGTFAVRARSRKDLENLVHEVWQVRGRPARPDIVKKAGTDYPYRIILGGPQFWAVITTLGELVKYPNFKASLRGTDQEPKSATYARWWGDALAFEDEEAKELNGRLSFPGVSLYGGRPEPENLFAYGEGFDETDSLISTSAPRRSVLAEPTDAPLCPTCGNPSEFLDFAGDHQSDDREDYSITWICPEGHEWTE